MDQHTTQPLSPVPAEAEEIHAYDTQEDSDETQSPSEASEEGDNTEDTFLHDDIYPVRRMDFCHMLMSDGWVYRIKD